MRVATARGPGLERAGAPMALRQPSGEGGAEQEPTSNPARGAFTAPALSRALCRRSSEQGVIGHLLVEISQIVRHPTVRLSSAPGTPCPEVAGSGPFGVISGCKTG